MDILRQGEPDGAFALRVFGYRAVKTQQKFVVLSKQNSTRREKPYQTLSLVSRPPKSS